jgi:hypothetical protein
MGMPVPGSSRPPMPISRGAIDLMVGATRHRNPGSHVAANGDGGMLAPIDTRRWLPYTGALDPYFVCTRRSADSLVNLVIVGGL